MLNHPFKIRNTFEQWKYGEGREEIGKLGKIRGGRVDKE